ncbi:unnamed protein product [Psylliodes chrysocephalus]|uniref:Uncharacterized protein n=1 Tax=Psylliodes chrysocephalus TaxID=3402493 RepID=A0A9P0CXG2_9CUCU|nr:unnamed protein product [Psylliodes chrysocephala]
MCKYRNVRLNADKTDTLKKHLKKKTKPQPGPSGTKRQSTIVGGFEVQKRVKMEKETFVEDTVKMCLKANIPMHKLDHAVPGSNNLSSGDILRRKHVHCTPLLRKKKLRSNLKIIP